MMTTYTYSVENDCPGVNIDRLQAVIVNSTISTALVRIDRHHDMIQIIFDDALSPSDRFLLDGNTTNPAGGLIASVANRSIPDIDLWLPDDEDELEARQRRPQPRNENIIIGYSAGVALDGGNNIIIGYSAGVALDGGNNIVIGQSAVGRIDRVDEVDELDDRDGFSRPHRVSPRFFFSRAVKERHPNWIAFRFITPLRPQQIITDGPNGENRYSGYISFVWDYESEIQRLFRVNRESMARLLNLGLDRENVTARRWLAQWEPAPGSNREMWGSVKFRPVLDPQAPADGIVGYVDLVEECTQRLERFPVEVDRRRDQSSPPSIQSRQRPDRQPRTAFGINVDEQEDTQLRDLLESIKGEPQPRVGPHFPMPGKTVQPPPGKIGGRKLDLS